ncbi:MULTISPECIES: hypothetical protein [unclassified Clostridium]|uniref:hypothetical protein n=1 Tax=unclassified Clostridium TaxID=2614128 RepID=UPI001C8C3A13|nr:MULTISPECIES: hypothetical protein [unclassified Clostridium]MBX9137889.1 hypothetical protein [Clostridium sp. K12(2020)]MBX9143454.1 hypothetical protein [Clostridium sp. K13]
MSRKFLLIFFFIIILLFGGQAKSISEENSGIFNFIGTWRIESLEKLGDKEDDEEDLAYLIGDEIQLDSNKVNILGIYKQNIHYKLKAVQGDYIISYENSLTMNEFMNGREMVDLISIIDKNQIIGEFFLNSDTEMILLYKSNLIKLRRINKSANFDDIKNDVVIGNETQEEEFDAKEGIMLGIKTPNKEIDEGIYSNEKYRTLWISHDNWKIGNVYEKPNIIFPRLNGIWKLEVNQKNSNGFEYDEFQVGKYDEKLKDNTVGKLNLDKSEYKTIKFVGNDYIAIGKYQGNSFMGNYPIYQIIPVNNINIENGLQIDEIFTGIEKEKYLEEFQGEINSLSQEQLEQLNISSINYNNLAIERRIGRWMFVANLLPRDINEAGESFKISILPDSRFINYNSLYMSWKALKQQLGFFKDVFISPLGKIALVQFYDYIAIYKIENGNLITEPLEMIPIGENDEIIMSEWSSGSYVEQWEKAFVDGELIIEN